MKISSLFHCNRGDRLTILHDIANDTKFIKVASSPFGSEWLFERDLIPREIRSSTRLLGSYLDVINVVPIPCGAKEFIPESQNQNVLDHLLAQIMVNSEDFILGPVWCERSLKLS
jgi:hypothetical protein